MAKETLKENQQFGVLIKIGCLFGLYIDAKVRRPNFWKSKFSNFYQKFLGLSWIIFILYVTIQTIKSKKSVSFTATAARQLSCSVAFSIWVKLMLKRREISKLLKEISNLETSFGVSVNIVTISICGFIVIFVPIVAWISKFVLFDEQECKYFVEYYSLDAAEIPDGLNCKVLAFITFFFSFLIYLPRTFTAALYVMVCHFFHKALKTHSITGFKKVINYDKKLEYANMKKHLLKYEEMSEVLIHFEETMSFTIFLLQVGDLVGMFAGIMWLNGRMSKSFQNVAHLNAWLGVFFLSLSSFLSFMCVSLAASNVHEAGKKYKEAEEKILKHVLTSMQERDISKPFLLLMAHQNPPFILSAWGFFHFTKGLILVAVGSVLTYSLLIIQITSYRT